MQKYSIQDEAKAYAEIQDMRREFESNPSGIIYGTRVYSKL